MTRKYGVTGSETRGSPGAVKRAWNNLGLDLDSVLKMVKFAVPPTICLCMYQSDYVSNVYSTVGYLIAVASVLSGVLQPRAIFLQTMIVNVVAISLTTAIATLAMWLAFQARKKTTPAGSSASGYNSSASAVSGVWLFFMIYVINSMKFSRPGLRFACVLSSIVTIITQTYGAQSTTMVVSLILVRNLYGAIMTGIAISTAVNLFFLPLSSRHLVFNDMRGYVEGIRKVLKAHLAYMHTLEDHNMFRETSEASILRDEVRSLRAVHGKLYTDLSWAKKEFAYGRLGGSDLSALQRLFRKVFLPVTGFITMTDVFDRVADAHGWNLDQEEKQSAKRHETTSDTLIERTVVDEYNHIMKDLHKPFGDLHDTMNDALDHILLKLRLRKTWSKHRNDQSVQARSKDVEASPNPSDPGGVGFQDRLRRDLDIFYRRRKPVLRAWCEEQGIQLAPNSFQSQFSWLNSEAESALFKTHRQRQLFVLLDIHLLMYSSGLAMLHLIEWIDNKVADGKWSQKRIIIPAQKQIMKWLRPFSHPRQDGDHLSMEDDASTNVHLGEAFHSRKDPDHLAPERATEHIGIILRNIASTLRSRHSIFGFRLACAVISIGIVAFLEGTQHFFVENRLFWAEIFVAVSMVRTTGEAGFIYFLRICGSILGAIVCYPVYYIVDGKTPGVLIFFFLAVTGIAYINVKNPRFTLVGMIATVTTIIVIGYTLQVRKIGEQAATTNQQKYYPLYLLAPYRLAVTMAGIFVAFIFTFFPFPSSERSELRKSLGQSLYLTARHYAVVQETVAARVRGDEGDISLKTSPGYRLEKERTKLLSRMMLLIAQMRTQSSFTHWQVPIDCRFPKKTYDALIDCVNRISSYTALIGCSSTAFAIKGDKAHEGWHQAFKTLLTHAESTQDQITSLLCLLSSSILNAQPLPRLQLPQPFELVRIMQTMDKDILSISHIAEPGYAGFAMLQISNRAIIADLHQLTDLVRELVGELDFSFHYATDKAKAA